MKYCLLLLFVSLYVSAYSQKEKKEPPTQTRVIKLHRGELRGLYENCHIVKVIDERPDTTHLGLIYIGISNAKRKLDIDGGLSTSLLRILQKNDNDQSDNKIVIHVKELKVTESATRKTEIATLDFSYDVRLLKDDQEIELFTLRSYFEKSATETTLLHRTNILASLEKTMRKLEYIDFSE